MQFFILSNQLFQKDLILKELGQLGKAELDPAKLLFGFHHHSHAASAFYPSPFEEATVVVMDGVGEWATTSVAAGSGSELEILREIRFPHSLGLLYSAFTYYLGFAVNEGEYKVMGLAPYGNPTFVDTIRDHLIDLRSDGSFALDMGYFDYCTGLTMTNENFDQLFGAPPRNVAEPLSQRHMDLARSVQVVVEEAIGAICRWAVAETGQRNLCLAGGVALNCVANGGLRRRDEFDGIWVQPAAGDAGGALGVALSISHDVAGVPRSIPGPMQDGMAGALLGPSFGEDEVVAALTPYGAVFRHYDDDDLFALVADALASESIVGWFQGRMEFGPRALGARSILADPRSVNMQRTLNLRIKYRESFRPFAPAVLRDEVGDHFEFDGDSRYMLMVGQVRETHQLQSDEELGGLEKLNAVRSHLPAITHVDYSARIQTVDAESNPAFYRLLCEFKALTGCGVLVNTSFNVRDEPIVCTPEDAYRCFMGSEMDLLVLGNTVLRKEEQ